MTPQSINTRMKLNTAIRVIFGNFPKVNSNQHDHSPGYLSGAPGGGKTRSIEAEALARNCHFISRNIGMAKLEEFGGIPDFYWNPKNTVVERLEEMKVEIEPQANTNTWTTTEMTVDNPEYNVNNADLHTVWSIPELICEIRNKSKEKPVVVILDDWHLAIPQVQALGYELFTDYSLKGYKIPENVLIVLAGNDTALAGAKGQFSAVMNRVQKILVYTDFDYWANVFGYDNVFPPIISFLDAKENRGYFHGEESATDPWPSPRSWTNLSKKIEELMSCGIWNELQNDDKLMVCTSFVGTIAASAFMTYYEIYLKIKAKDIFDSGNYDIPVNAVDRFAFTYAISFEFLERYTVNRKDESSIKIFVKILKDLEAKHSELAMVSIRYITARGGKILEELAVQKKIDMKLLSQFHKTSMIMRSY